jgi:sulfite oxidase
MTATGDRILHDPAGLNAAGRPADLVGHAETPIDCFFTRSHAPIPAIDSEAWRLEIGGLVGRALSLSLADLRDGFARREVAATLVCAGLRRNEYHGLGPLPGELPWGPEAAGNGRWAGVALRDVLRAAELSNDARHVHFTGLDRVERKGSHAGFGGSIDVAKALEPDVLLAFEMNGETLPPAHGFPLRAVVPGWIGARSVKWLGGIAAAAEPSANYFQTEAYRVLRTQDPARPRDVTAGTPLSGLTVNSVILDPAPGQRIAPGAVTVRGWAIGSEGHPVTRVEISPDDGRTWSDAALVPDAGRWTWTRWKAGLLLGPGPHSLIVRATDATGAAQPALVRDTWNVKGYLNNAWHRVGVVAE